MKILLAIDGSPCSDAAVEEVARRPWPQGSMVKVLTAVEITPPIPITPEAWASCSVPFRKQFSLTRSARSKWFAAPRLRNARTSNIKG